jgi:hypothetical protein
MCPDELPFSEDPNTNKFSAPVVKTFNAALVGWYEMQHIPVEFPHPRTSLKISFMVASAKEDVREPP